MRYTVALPDSVRPGLQFCSRTLLRAGVVLLGLTVTLSDVRQLSWDGLLVLIVVVAGTFWFTVWVGKRLGLDRAGSVLVATGTAICGASAVAAMSAVLPDMKKDVDDGAAVAVASVTL